MNEQRKRILTGDRPTGKLHLGHYLGSLQTRINLQYEYDSYILIADVQALTTHWENEEILAENVVNIAADYLSAGLDPEACTIVIQSMLPEIHELATYFALYTSVNVLRHNPTIKTEALQHNFTDMTYGFLGYPVSQAADISIFKAHLVPVGEDQIPHIELARKLIRRFNELYKPVLVEPQAITSSVTRLVGLDGKNKMSKSLNNCIYLADDRAAVLSKVKSAVTDPARIRKNDPGHPEVCTVFAYHKILNPGELAEITAECQQGNIGCVQCKNNLAGKINLLLEPMHERRNKYKNPDLILDIIAEGTKKARKVAQETMEEVRSAMSINYFDIYKRQ
ncbi:MAG: tryptophan--tRNA ligase [Syntrophomonadaceae bacterium]|jgi:tryptophanyl-tRNA synthetase|nr:tryptophan--tRNA ligase [Syntrophomonadaceae bacterium]